MVGVYPLPAPFVYEGKAAFETGETVFVFSRVCRMREVLVYGLYL